MRQCYKCGWEWRKPHEPAFREMCPRCDAFLHTCKNCSFFEESAYHQCKVPTVEYVKDKERGNFCEDFRFLKKKVAPPETSSRRNSRRNSDSSTKSNNSRSSSSTGSSFFGEKSDEQKLDPREKWRRLFKED